MLHDLDHLPFCMPMVRLLAGLCQLLAEGIFADAAHVRGLVRLLGPRKRIRHSALLNSASGCLRSLPVSNPRRRGQAMSAKSAPSGTYSAGALPDFNWLTCGARFFAPAKGWRYRPRRIRPAASTAPLGCCSEWLRRPRTTPEPQARGTIAGGVG